MPYNLALIVISGRILCDRSEFDLCAGCLNNNQDGKKKTNDEESGFSTEYLGKKSVLNVISTIHALSPEKYSP